LNVWLDVFETLINSCMSSADLSVKGLQMFLKLTTKTEKPIKNLI